MKRILLTALGEFVDLKVLCPETFDGQALVRVHRVGVCGSDFHAFGGMRSVCIYPRVLGHELPDEIVGVPENA